MEVIQLKGRVTIQDAIRFSSSLQVYLAGEKGEVIALVTLPKPDATAEEVDQAVRQALKTEAGAGVPELIGREIEYEYEVEA
ncbi:MAG TPA: hypothetical protein DIT43_01855 [Dehalococcoidia bacterium]|nr:hypothetical protein [Dehalococcoidia bacterium]